LQTTRAWRVILKRAFDAGVFEDLAFQGLAGAKALAVAIHENSSVAFFLAWKPVTVLTLLHITFDLFIKVASIEAAGE
jgi:hypothetical protein